MDARGVPEANSHRQSGEDQLAIDRADLEHWTQVRADQLASGEAMDYSRDTVAVGDLVRISGYWHAVARCNARTVAVQTGHSWTDKAPWHQVQDHRPRDLPAPSESTRDAPAAHDQGEPTPDPNRRPDGQPSPGRGVEHQKREAPSTGPACQDPSR